MDLSTLKSYQRTIASVDLPLKHFVETGFWNPYANGDWEDFDIGDTQVRRACRKVAQELKRPFIQCYCYYQKRESYDTGKKSNHGYTIYATRPLPAPRFDYAFVQIPKQKRLINLATPLLLAANDDRHDHSAPVWQGSLASLWQFRITSEEFWNQYYEFALNDPDCRKARRLTS